MVTKKKTVIKKKSAVVKPYVLPELLSGSDAEKEGLAKAKKLANDAMNSIDLTVTQRKSKYEVHGGFDSFSIIAQDLKDVMRKNPGWLCLSPDKREGLEMIAHKIARILNGDPEYKDSWHDIQGYAKRVEEYCLPGGNNGQ